MAFQGQSTDLTLSEILGLCISKSKPGFVEIKAKSAEYCLSFQDSKISGISCPAKMLSLPDILLERNQISRNRLQECQNDPNFTANPVQYLLDNKIASSEQIQLARYHQAEEIFFILLFENHGSFDFINEKPQEILYFDLAFRDWIAEVIPNPRKLMEFHTSFPDLDQRLFWISPQEYKDLIEQISLNELRVLAYYSPRMTVRNYWYALTGPKADISDSLINLSKSGILTTILPVKTKPPDSRPFLRALLSAAISRIENVQQQLGVNGELTSILKQILNVASQAVSELPVGDTPDNLDDLSSITSSFEDVFAIDDLKDLHISNGAPEHDTSQEKPEPKKADEKPQDLKSESKIDKKKPTTVTQEAASTRDQSETFDEPEEAAEEYLSLEDRVQAKVRYKQFISNVTMAHNRLRLKSMTYFDLLGVSPTADRRTVHKSFIKIIQKINPKGINLLPRDQKYMEKAVEIRDQLKTAYKTIMDPKLRKEYIVFLRQGRLEEEKKKSQALVLFNQGMAFFSEGKFDEARKLFKEAVQHDPNSPVYYDMLEEIEKEERATNATKFFQAGVIAFIKKKDIDRAVKLIKKAISLAPGQISYFLKLAEIQSTKPEYRQEAIQNFQIAIDSDPGNLELRTQFAEFLKSSGLKQEAANVYQDALKWNPENLAIRRELAIMKKEGVVPKKTIDQKEKQDTIDDDEF